MNIPGLRNPPSSLLAFLLVWAFGGMAPAALAANCGGGGAACGCGDTVTVATTLATDLGPCTGNGLYVKSGVALDCAGHTVSGSNLPGAWYGISLDMATGGAVRNCRVTAFRRGIRIRGGGLNTVADNEIFLNKYGIDVALASTDNRIEGNAIHDQRDEGIHVGTGAHRTVIVDNEIWNTKREHIYLLAADDCRIEGNMLRASRRAAIYVKNSDRNQVIGNTVRDRAVQVRGDSSDNVFTGNDLTGNGFIVDAQLSPEGVWLFPHDNLFSGGSIRNTGYCFRFYGAYDNLATAIGTDGRCVPITEGARGELVPYGNSVEVVPLS